MLAVIGEAPGGSGMRMSGWGLLACMAWLSCSPAAIAAAASSVPATPTQIRVVAPDDYPPFLSLDADGKPQGYEVDRWKLFQAHSGIRVELATMDWRAATQALLSGQADVIDMIYHTSARDAQYDFSLPYATLPTGVYVDRSVEGVHDLPSLQGLQVGVDRGDACGPKLQSLGFTALREFGDARQVVRAATRGSSAWTRTGRIAICPNLPHWAVSSGRSCSTPASSIGPCARATRRCCRRWSAAWRASRRPSWRRSTNVGWSIRSSRHPTGASPASRWRRCWR